MIKQYDKTIHIYILKVFTFKGSYTIQLILLWFYSLKHGENVISLSVESIFLFMAW